MRARTHQVAPAKAKYALAKNPETMTTSHTRLWKYVLALKLQSAVAFPHLILSHVVFFFATLRWAKPFPWHRCPAFLSHENVGQHMIGRVILQFSFCIAVDLLRSMKAGILCREKQCLPNAAPLCLWVFNLYVLCLGLHVTILPRLETFGFNAPLC
jgi:hypothetical protein